MRGDSGCSPASSLPILPLEQCIDESFFCMLYSDIGSSVGYCFDHGCEGLKRGDESVSSSPPRSNEAITIPPQQLSPESVRRKEPLLMLGELDKPLNTGELLVYALNMPKERTGYKPNRACTSPIITYPMPRLERGTTKPLADSGTKQFWLARDLAFCAATRQGRVCLLIWLHCECP